MPPLALRSICCFYLPGGPDRPVVRPDAGVFPHTGQFHQLPGARAAHRHPGETRFNGIKQGVARLHFSACRFQILSGKIP